MRRILFATLTLLAGMAAHAQTTVMTEDFSGATNIFGVTATELNVGSASVYDTGLSGFGNVLAVCNTTAQGTISNSDSQPVTFDNSIVTVEWDAFHGYYASTLLSTVSLLNSDGQTLASYTYDCKACKITAATIGGNAVAGFEAFSLQSKGSSGGANGFGGNDKPYVATAGNNPHITISMTARGGVEMKFTLQGNTTTLLGSTGSMKKDVAKMTVNSKINNTDRCYAIDNIKVTTEEMVVDPDYVEGIASMIISGAEKMTFGPSPDEAYSNAYSVVITGTDGTTITEDNLNEKVTDFNVVWDIKGFQTENDTEGQYCDSYGSFAVNNQGKVATSFDLRDVPMNFFGKMTATVTYNGETFTAEKYVIAQGDKSTAAGQVLPLAGYPSTISSYSDALKGYKLADQTYGNASDLIVGGWCVAGSDTKNAVILGDNDGTKYVRLTGTTVKKSHVMTTNMTSPSSQIIFTNRVRFNNSGAVITFTSGYPFWSSSKYTCPVTLNFDGSKLTLNGTALTLNDATATISTGKWYDIVLSSDKTCEGCYAMVYDTNGNLLGKTDLVAWAETSSPTYFSIGMGNSNTGSVDMASYTAVLPTLDATTYTITADKTTISIPQQETATLTATATDSNGYPITGLATWTVVEEDMQASLTITPDATDSHKAVVSLTDVAEAGTATVQVSIGGVVKTIELNITSSAESVRFTKSTTSISIPMSDDETAEATFKAIVIDGEGNDMHREVTLALYDKTNTEALTTMPEGITFDAATGLMTVSISAQPMTLTVRATGLSSDNNTLTKAVKVNIHGMKFDFGYDTEDGLAEGYTLVTTTTAYDSKNGYGIKSGSTTVGGTASATDAQADWLEGTMEFDFNVQRGAFYTIEITYQGTLTTGYINSDLAGYELGSSTTMTTATYVIPATVDVIDLHIAPANNTSVAKISQITVTKQAPRQKRTKRVVHHIGDSTSANNGSWAYRLSKNYTSQYPELAAECDFQNNGAGGRNLCTYYTQGKLAGVLRDIYPDDVVMFGNNGTNGMGSSFEDDMNYYLDAAETLGAKIIINSYTPHGAVAGYANGYNSTTNTFDSYRRDSYETIVRKVAAERAESDPEYMGFVEIGKNADAIFNAYVADYAANGYASADAAAQAIIACFGDHNHYSEGTLACDLMLNGYSTVPDAPGIVAQLVTVLTSYAENGDVNGDGQVGIADIVAVTNVMASITTDAATVKRADVNGDGQVGIADIVAITNIMAGK